MTILPANTTHRYEWRPIGATNELGGWSILMARCVDGEWEFKQRFVGSAVIDDYKVSTEDGEMVES